MSPRAHTALLALAAIGAVTADGILYELSDEQYYQMPQLFHLDEYDGCLASRGAYCLGSFELSPDHGYHDLYDVMKRYSANWVDHFNHTRLHRGLCLPRSCAAHARAHQHTTHIDVLEDWFSTCVNATMFSTYNLSARLYQLDYCQVGGAEATTTPLSSSERAFAVFVAILFALSAVSTVLDLTLSEETRKGTEWALSWSLPGCWRALVAASGPAPAPAPATDLRALDGLRVLAMMCVIVEHVCWIATHSYLLDTRNYEQIRRDVDAVLMANSTLVVQIFFMMSSFLLAHKVLQQGSRGEPVPVLSTFVETMVNRVIRISPSYFAVLWFAASWWERLGRGPMWAPLVGREAAICRRKWWTHLLYVNNVVQADAKCLIQTWYLAADMQLYGAGLALTLALGRWRAAARGPQPGRGALAALGALLGAALALLGARAYASGLVPTYVMHRPESVRATYRDEASFDALYQAPLGNAAGALAGLLLAHLHHALLHRAVQLNHYKVFCWVSIAATPLAVWWVAASPLLLGRGPPGRGAAALLAALERPVFSLFVGLAMLGAMNGVPSWVGRFLSWRGWAVWARLSFGALLLHMPLDKALVAARRAPSRLDRPAVIIEWFGVAAASYLCALPLALLLELPAQRLLRALLPRRPRTPPAAPSPRAGDKTDL